MIIGEIGVLYLQIGVVTAHVRLNSLRVRLDIVVDCIKCDLIVVRVYTPGHQVLSTRGLVLQTLLRSTSIF